MDIQFIRNKLKGISFTSIFRQEIEGWLFMLTSLFPGLIGFLLRRVVGKMLFKSTNGMQWIQPRVIFVDAKNITIGANVAINSNTYINGVGGVEIQDYVLIGSNVTISSGKHPINGTYPEVIERQVIPLKITLCRGVWIGSGAVIMPGITVGVGSIIGANAIVTKDTQPNSINVGIPARCIGFRS
jgi:galactoside O-acetyltransferase